MDVSKAIEKLAGLPVVGALFKGKDGGTSSSEFGVVAFLAPTILAIEAPGWAKVFALALLGVGYSYARGKAKTTEGAAVMESVPDAPAAAAGPAKAGALLLAVCLLAGCASAEREAYHGAIGGMVSTADAVDPPDGSPGLLRSDLTPGETALRDAWRFQRTKGRDLVAAEKDR